MKYSEIWDKPRKLKADKWDHYFAIYDHCISKFYNKKISFLEIGVQNGGSIEIAQNLFDSISSISGLDIDEKQFEAIDTLKSYGAKVIDQVAKEYILSW